jgi:hypothetical protein
MKKITILLLASVTASRSVSAPSSGMYFTKCDYKSNRFNAAVVPTDVTFSKAHSFYENSGSAAFAKPFSAALAATNLDLIKSSLTF